MREANGVNLRAVGVQAIGIGKSFGAFRALKNVSLDIGRGEFLTLLGPSGSGKTTFLMILAGFERATAGRLLSEGEDITAKSAESRVLWHGVPGLRAVSAYDRRPEHRLPAQGEEGVRATSSAAASPRSSSASASSGQEQKLPAKLSGGQQQRVALARALVFEPSVLLLDEPFSALDKHLRGRMQDEVKRLHQDFGTTFIFVTHDQSEALSLSSRIAIFNHGEVLQISTPQDVYERPANRFVAEFLGEINLLPIENIGHCNIGTSGSFEGGTPHRAAPGSRRQRPELSRSGRSTCLSPTAARRRQRRRRLRRRDDLSRLRPCGSAS